MWSQCRWLTRIEPRKACAVSFSVSVRMPVPASMSNVGSFEPAGTTATHEVCPPYRT